MKTIQRIKEMLEGSEMTKRSLYQCFNAKVKDDRIYCARGYDLGVANTKNGTVSLLKLTRGAPLELTICQNCVDYDEMGPPVPRGERGWAK